MINANMECGDVAQAMKEMMEEIETKRKGNAMRKRHTGQQEEEAQKEDADDEIDDDDMDDADDYDPVDDPADVVVDC